MLTNFTEIQLFRINKIQGSINVRDSVCLYFDIIKVTA